MKNNGLNTYDDNIIPIEHKNIFKYALFVLVAIGVLLGVISIFYNDLFVCFISFLIGGILSVLLFYITHKIIDSSYYLHLKKSVKKIHLIYQLTYMVTFVLIAYFTKSALAIAGVTIGLLLVKIASLINIMVNKKNN